MEMAPEEFNLPLAYLNEQLSNLSVLKVEIADEDGLSAVVCDVDTLGGVGRVVARDERSGIGAAQGARTIDFYLR